MRCSNSLSSTLSWSVATFGATLLASAALAQDECTTAVTVTAGTPASFDTTSATPSANPPQDDSQCPGTYLSWGTANPDVWFRFVAPQTGLVDFSTCLSTSYDTSMVIYKGSSCGSLTQVACNGDGEGENGCQDYYSRVAGLAAQPGEVFYIRIGGYTGASGTSDSGSGALTVTFNAVNPGCAGSTGACGQAHGGLGCDDPVCCSTVCDINPPCCSVEWDSFCVETAVSACGIFVYNCPSGGPANDCATNATVVSSSGSRTFNNTAANTDGPNHSGDTCASGNDSFFNDVWYRVPVVANGVLKIETCNAVNFDSKLAVYDMGTTPASFDFNNLPAALVGCNDDGNAECQVNAEYASSLTVTVLSGRSYLVRVATYDNPGSGTVTFTVPVPCELSTPTQIETEACGDATNNGCNGAGETESLILGGTISGRFSAANNTRDTDFYRLDIASDTQVTLSVRSASLVNLLVLGGDLSVPGCAGVSVLATGSGACPTTASICLRPGTYYAFVSPTAFDGIPCGSGALNNYTLTTTATPAECPIILGTACEAPGPDNRQLSIPATPAGNFVQACATGCGNLAGGSAEVLFATKIQGGNLLKEITCMSFGVAALRSQNGTNGVCGFGTSDRLIPMDVQLYRDIDGGDPTRISTAAGDGNDLELIESYRVLVPSGVSMGSFTPSEPLCVENETNLVFVLRTPNLFNGTVEGVPAGAGYRAGIGVAPQTPGEFWPSNVFSLAALCGGTQFGAIGAGAYQWPVIINGTAGSCPGSGGGNDCPADLNGDGLIGALDLTAVLAGWGSTAGDINGDGTTNGVDLTSVLSAWNTACP